MTRNRTGRIGGRRPRQDRLTHEVTLYPPEGVTFGPSPAPCLRHTVVNPGPGTVTVSVLYDGDGSSFEYRLEAECSMEVQCNIFRIRVDQPRGTECTIVSGQPFVVSRRKPGIAYANPFQQECQRFLITNNGRSTAKVHLDRRAGPVDEADDLELGAGEAIEVTCVIKLIEVVEGEDVQVSHL